MAMSATTTFPKILKALRENSNVKEKRDALTYISSQAKKLESNGAVKEERYKELCKLIIEAFTKDEGSLQYEALEALRVIVNEFQTHSLYLFESILQTNKRIRLKILKLLEVVEDNAITAAANDGQALNFFKNCMENVQPSLMEWITSTACTDNLQMLTRVEHQVLSDEQKLEEDTISYSLALLKRLYKLAAITRDLNIERFDALLMDKIVTLAYMGHKRQRGFALKVLQEAVANNTSLRICKDHPDIWTQYKNNLQSMYCKRMLLLVAACEPDWTTQWNITIQFLGTDLHRGAGLINNLLSVEEKAFKSTDTIIRRQAFLSWKLLIDNFALDHQELATARRIKLLCIPLNAKNSKTELIALTKLEVWWHLIIKLYKDIAKFVTPVIVQFLNFCFGPLGDTPLLSTKFDVVASPGKRFLKTKVVALDALYQLVVPKEENSTICAAMLEERLPHTISFAVFQECSKSIIHSTGEALLILAQLTDQEMKNRFQFGKILWASLITYIKNLKLEQKDHLYRDVIVIITELGNYIDKPMMKEIIFNVILPDLNQIIKNTEFVDNALPELVLKLLSLPMLGNGPRDFSYYTIKCLLQRCVSPEITYSSGVLGFLETIVENLGLVSDAHTITIYTELWCIIAEILTKYIAHYKKIEESNENEDKFKAVKTVLSYPFQYSSLEIFQIQEQTIIWKALYKQFELQADSIGTVKPNEILLDIASMMQKSLKTNKDCSSLIVNCLDALLSTVNYECLLAQDEIPSIMQLIIDVTTTSFNNSQHLNCEIALKTLSAMLITIYGHKPRKIELYLYNCKPVIELMFQSQLTISKEITSTWETIISIFKGLNKQLKHELLSSYKEILVITINHPNSNIKFLTQSILEIKDDLDNTVKCILDEIEKTIEKPTSHPKTDSVTKKKEEAEKSKEMRVTGSFLSKKSVNTKSVANKSLEKNDKKTFILPESDSQGYVYIKTDLKFDVNRLTEHQKETLKKKRDDIPALYNDLSQSSSQDSQNLQEWFNIKAKHINESDKINNSKKNDSITHKPISNDANKENKITVVHTELNMIDKIVNNNSKLDENIGENILDIKHKDLTKEIGGEDFTLQNEDMGTSKQVKSTSHSKSTIGQDSEQTLEANEEKDIENSIASVAKKLNFESREEFPEDNMHEQQLSPSMLDSTKRRYRNNTTKLSSSLRSDEVTSESKKSQSTMNIQRTLRMKTIQGKASTSGKEKTQDDTDIKENSNENKKVMKRKYTSDTESDGVVQRQKRKLMSSSKDSNNDDNKSRDNDNLLDMDTLSQRMKTEISRLKIDMVFDCPGVNRRRIKYSDDETTLKKTSTSDNKSLKLKSVDIKSGDTTRKFPKTIEKNVKDTNDTNKRRGRKSTKQESDKNDLDVIKESRKSSDTTDKLSQSKNSGSIDATYVVSMSGGAVQNTTTNKVQDEKLDKNNMSSSDKNTEFVDNVESNEQSQDEIEDVVESSQGSDANIELNKRCGEKQCFIKIDKIINIQAIKTSDAIVEKNYVPESASVDYTDNDVPGPGEQSDEVIPDNNTEVSDEGNKDNVNKNSVQDNDSTNNTKTIIPQNQKVIDSSALIKSASVTNFSSPKSNNKTFKLKPFTVHGRAAHMLGLVTRQSQIDNDGTTIEDDPLIKKLKNKDIETETLVNKKIHSIKEVDKIGGPSGSRQEKIFSNMRSADYCISSPYAFNTLRNDGEKLSSKLDKSTSDLSMESSTDKENEGNKSPSCEKDDLPILEWSSANPPSLTASPSASILKRHRSSLSDVDSDFITSNKRKRVSFADPPVSKEMGYEIGIMDSPSKGNKCSMTRVITPKKDSPLKLKQTKLKLATAESEKSINDVDAQNEDSTILSAEKINESLTKISEAYSDGIDVDTSCNSSENDNVTEANSHMKIKIDNLALEVEITVDSISNTPENQQLLSFETLQNSSSIESIEMQESETQQDIFDGMDAKNNIASIQRSNDNIDTSIQNNSVDSIKLNVTNDSVTEALPREENLEDTVDIQNITELNSTINPDEIFCGKLLRTSTHTTENVMEQDTLLATDSVFASLPLTENDRNENQNDVEIEPEFLDSTQPIYPTLSSCREPLDIIVGQLTNPLWKQNLLTYFANRSLRTIGDLAQLSEREIHRIPVKGKPKIEFVRKVLQYFENISSTTRQKRSLPTCIYAPQADPSDQMVQSPTTDEALNVSVAPISDPVKAVSATTENESVSYNCSTPLPQSSRKALDNRLLAKSPIEYLDKIGSMNSDINVSSESINLDISALNASKIEGQTNLKVSVTAHNSFETSMDDKLIPIATSSTSANTKTMNEILPDGNMTASEISLNVCDEPLITHSSIGTSTDDLCSPESSVNKATKSVGSQMALEELLDEIDINLVLESAIRRCSPEAILSQYKQKMGHLTEAELAKETIRILGFHNQRQLNDSLLKAVCRAYGLNKVLLRLPDIFNSDKQFFDKVFKVYNKKLKIIDCLNAFDCTQLRSAVCQKYTTSELAEMLSDKLKQDEQEGIKQPMPELSSLNAMLQRLPMDVIISHTVANEEVIPASVVLDIALQNNSSEDIARALQAQSPARARNVLGKLRTSQFTVEHIENEDVSKENLLNIFKSVCSKLTTQELLNAYHEAMTSKLIVKQDKQ